MERTVRLSLVVLALTVAPAAAASWRALNVPGTPHDVQVWAPSVYTVATVGNATTTGGVGLVRGTTGTFYGVGDSVGSYYFQDATKSCLYALLTSGEPRAIDLGSVGCPAPGAVFAQSTRRARRVKHTATGGAFATQTLSTINEGRYSAQGLAGGTWTSILELSNQTPTDALAALRFAGSDHGLVGVRGSGPAVVWTIGNTAAGTFRVPASAGNPTELDLTEGAGGSPTAFLATDGGLLRGRLLPAGSPELDTGGVLVDGGTLFPPVALPAVGRVAGVDVNQDGGVPGDGFGLATHVGADGVVRILSAVPSVDPASVGTQWRVNPTFPPSAYPDDFSSTSPLRQVSCVGSRFCIIALERSSPLDADPANVLIYENLASPIIPDAGVVSIDEGTSTEFGFFDADGDAVLLLVDPPTTPALTVATAPADGGVVLSLQANTICADVSTSVALRASDGRHLTTGSLSVTVRHTVRPASPGVALSAPGTWAGGPEVTLTASPAPTGCTPSGYEFRAATDSPALVAMSASQARFVPPATLCQAAPKRYAYDVVAQDSAGESSPTRVEVEVAPWGAPRAPFAAPVSLALTAGQRATLVPDGGLHTCATTAGFPGVATRWELVGPPPPAGVRLEGPDGGVVALPVDVPALTVASDDCLDATLQLRATHATRDTAGLSGTPSDVSVTVATVLAPLTADAVRLTGTQARADALTGTLQTDLNCTARRALTARLEVVREGGAPVASTVAPVPGPFTLPLPGGCNGGRFVLRAQLEDSTGSVASSAGFAFDAPRLPAALEPLAPAPLVARCGAGARTTLAQQLPPEACQAVGLSWSVVPETDSPAAELVDVSGTGATLRTLDTGLDALVGRTVRVRVTADAGAGNVAEAEHLLPITVEPFVELVRRSEAPVAAEGDATGITVALRNPEACAVTGVRLEERLEGASFVEGSARLDGVPVAAAVEGGVLRVEGVSLPAGGTASLTYLVRPALLGRPRASGEARLRGVRISRDGAGALAPDDGCGCQGSGSGVLSAAGLLAWVLVLRRRRGAGATARS